MILKSDRLSLWIIDDACLRMSDGRWNIFVNLDKFEGTEITQSVG